MLYVKGSDNICAFLIVLVLLYRQLTALMATEVIKILKIFDLRFRFRHTAAHASWDVSSGACDAIALSVDLTGITLHGVGVYCAHHDQEQGFVCEVNPSPLISLVFTSNFRWSSLLITTSSDTRYLTSYIS